MLPNKPRGVRRVDDGRVLDGIVWVLRSGAPWRDLPATYGPARRITIASFGGCWTYLADLPDVSNVYFGARRVPATVHGVVFNILAGERRGASMSLRLLWRTAAPIPDDDDGARLGTVALLVERLQNLHQLRMHIFIPADHMPGLQRVVAALGA